MATPVSVRAFTLVELLVVVGIIALLVTIFLAATGSVFTDAKARETRSVLKLLDMAVEQFKEDAPLKRVAAYRARYGDYPCDELEPFHQNSEGIPGSASGGTPVLINPGGMNADLNVNDDNLLRTLHRDIKAMALVIKLYSPVAAAHLERIPTRYRKAPASSEEFFDRNNDSEADPDDETLTYFDDAWGTPIEYYALADPKPDAPPAQCLPNAPTDMLGYRRKASSFFVKANRGRPVFISYGPDGKDQMAARSAGVESPMVADYDADGQNHRIDDSFNADNVFLDDAVKDRIIAGDGGT